MIIIEINYIFLFSRTAQKIIYSPVIQYKQQCNIFELMNCVWNTFDNEHILNFPIAQYILNIKNYNEERAYLMETNTLLMYGMLY